MCLTDLRDKNNMDLRGRKAMEREIESFIYWLIPQTPTTATIRPGRSQEPKS